MSSIESMSSTSLEPRLCENADCKIGNLIPILSKQNPTQFVIEPNIAEKPLLINGLTAVFQTCGTPAKLAEIKKHDVPTKVTKNTGDSSRPIYRIKPGTHVHIMNYIVVDDESDVLRKINEGDTETLRIMLHSQRQSAQQKLQKLMEPSKPSTIPTTELSSTHPVVTKPSMRPAKPSAAPHPNLKIASVASAVPFLAPMPPSTDNSAALVAQATPPVVATMPETTTIDKMQEELQELRRTVARLAANAKRQ